jgi:hypothetical protein
MPIPTVITDLSTTAASNYPQGTDSPATLDDTQRAHGAFIRQLQTGAVTTTANVTSGTINGATIGATTPSTGAFTTLSSNVAGMTSPMTFGQFAGSTTYGQVNFNGATTLAGFSGIIGGSTAGTVYVATPSGGTIRQTVNGTDIATVSASGLSVTGALSATGVVSSATQFQTTSSNPGGGGFVPASGSWGAGTVVSYGADNTNNAWINTPSGKGIYFNQNNSTLATLDTSGNWGLGGVTPSAWGAGIKGLEIGAVGDGFSDVSNTFSVNANIWQTTGGAARYGRAALNGSSYQQFNGSHSWYTYTGNLGAGNAPSTTSQAMTLDASGNLLVAKTSGVDTTVGAYIAAAGNSSFTMASSSSANTGISLYSTGAAAYRFYVDMGGTIHATSTSITAISDGTLKQNVKPLETGITEVMALKPVRFDWINGDGTNVAGFISQEVQQVLPDLTTPFKYTVDAEGNDVMKLGLRMGDMLPTLVKAIQEQQAQIQALTARLAAAGIA